MGCITCRDAGLGPYDYSVRGRGWRCKTCGWTLLEPELWSRHVHSSNHEEAELVLRRRTSLQAALESLTQQVSEAHVERQRIRTLTKEELDQRESEARAQIAIRTRDVRAGLDAARSELERIRGQVEGERAKLRGIQAKAKEVSGFIDAEAKARAAGRETARKRAEAERAQRERVERRNAEIDRRLLAGEGPRYISESVGFVTEGQVRGRQAALAKMKVHRGKPWAEAALDKEILRLTLAGVRREAVAEQLDVGENRIARIRRQEGLKGKRLAHSGAGLAPAEEPGSTEEPDSTSGSRSDPNSPASEDDDRRRERPRKEERDEFGDPVHPDGVENDWAWGEEDEEKPRRGAQSGAGADR